DYTVGVESHQQWNVIPLCPNSVCRNTEVTVLGLLGSWDLQMTPIQTHTNKTLQMNEKFSKQHNT
ncbi:hypothetical protein DVA81_19420, partial [Acinetobacter baumannii]